MATRAKKPTEAQEATTEGPEGPEVKVTPPSGNLYERIVWVRQQVGYIQKDVTIKTGGKPYKALSHDAVVAFTREALNDAGIAVFITVAERPERDVAGETSNGATIWRWTAGYDVEFVYGDWCHTIRVWSEAMDTSDKAAQKAESVALKIALTKTFLIESGEDEESRVEQGTKPLTEEQVVALRKVCAFYGLPEQATLDRMSQTLYNVEAVEHVARSQYDEMLRLLELKGFRSGNKNRGVKYPA